ncbi:hypothetical protein TH61_06785 [Rufibacter sp. DG15C]|nr:hypothetical protein TH61_06785 [Rufibacter sp. DG15C]
MLWLSRMLIRKEAGKENAMQSTSRNCFKAISANYKAWQKGNRAGYAPGLLVKVFGRGKKGKAIPVQDITQGRMMRRCYQAHERLQDGSGYVSKRVHVYK